MGELHIRREDLHRYLHPEEIGEGYGPHSEDEGAASDPESLMTPDERERQEILERYGPPDEDTGPPPPMPNIWN